MLKINLALIVLSMLFSSAAYARCISCEEQLAPPRNDIIVERQTYDYEP